MKKALLLVLTIAWVLSLSACGGAGERPAPLPDAPTTPPTESSPSPTVTEPEGEAETDYMLLYNEIIKDYVELIVYRFSADFDPANAFDLPHISDTLKETLSDLGDLASAWENMVTELPASYVAELPNYYGTVLHDLNGDNIPELFWVRNDHSIVAVFTCKGDRVILLDAFWPRYQGFITEDGILYTHSSSGATEHQCCIHSLGTESVLMSSCLFGSEGDSSGAVKYYEYSGTSKSQIAESRYEDLLGLYPYENSPFWQSVPISPLAAPMIPEAFASYRVKIPRRDFPIWTQPDYESTQVGTVEIAGTYTIVDEAMDESENRWGKLKSGAGWVDLTLIEEEKNNPPIITADYASKKLLSSENYHFYHGDDSEYAVQVAFCAHKPLTDVSISSLDCSYGYEELVELYHLDHWDPEVSLVAQLSFPGDMSMYSIRFTDESGTVHRYAIAMSAKGFGPAFDLFEYTPTSS